MSQLTQRVPVGFRFHPTDEELVGYYLPKKVTARKIDLDLIRDLDLYKLEPWDLQDLCKIQADSNEKQTDYYFFSRKDKKYPTGNRANRATTKGFWKATGRDKPIHTKHQALIGMRKTLVFYQGRAPHGVKTDWIMHEFRLDDGPGRPAHEDGGWVVCRVFKKNKNLKLKLQERATVSFEEQMGLLPEPQSSPDILSGGGRFAFPDRSQYGGQYGSGIKQEIINLDDYQIAGRGQYVDNSFNNYAMPTKVEQQHPNVVHTSHSMPSSADARAYLALPMSLRRGDDFLNIPESPVHGFHEHGETSSGTSDGATTDGDECGILGSLSENVDWSAILQDPPAKVFNNPDSMLVHLKRTSSDIFSSMELWNYTQVTQGI